MPAPSRASPARATSSCRSARRTRRATWRRRWPGASRCSWTPTRSPPPPRGRSPPPSPARAAARSTAGSSGRRPGATVGQPAAVGRRRGRRRASLRRHARARAGRRDGDRRGVGDEDGLRRLDEGQRGAAAGRPRLRQGGGRRGGAPRRVGISHPELEERSAQAARGAAGKAWRWVGEMEEIAASLAAAGLPAASTRPRPSSTSAWRRVGGRPGRRPDALSVRYVAPGSGDGPAKGDTWR